MRHAAANFLIDGAIARYSSSADPRTDRVSADNQMGEVIDYQKHLK
jgi:hypothetical protein